MLDLVFNSRKARCGGICTTWSEGAHKVGQNVTLGKKVLALTPDQFSRDSVIVEASVWF